MNASIAVIDFLCDSTKSKDISWEASKTAEANIVYTTSKGRFVYQLEVGKVIKLRSCHYLITSEFKDIATSNSSCESLLETLKNTIREASYFNGIEDTLIELCKNNAIKWNNKYVKKNVASTTYRGETDDVIVSVSYTHDRDDDEYYNVYVMSKNEPIRWQNEYDCLSVSLNRKHVVNYLIENVEEYLENAKTND